MEPIGFVHNDLQPGTSPPRKRSARSIIKIRPELAEGLRGIEPGQYLVLLFQFHLAPPPAPLLQHPQGDRARPVRGVFALRSPHRPNPIGLTTVRVLRVAGNELTVSGLDAYDGTPVLDIKPYIPFLDEAEAPGQEA